MPKNFRIFSLACKAISSTPPFSVNSAAFLNSIIEYCTSETSKPKTGHANMEVLQMALKIVTNCCSCVEGRMLIAKVSRHCPIRIGRTFSRFKTFLLKIQFPDPNASYLDSSSSTSNSKSQAMATADKPLAYIIRSVYTIPRFQ